MADVEPQDTVNELMSLYTALRATPDPRTKQAIKQRIDFLVEQANREFQPMMLGAAPSARKANV